MLTGEVASEGDARGDRERLLGKHSGLHRSRSLEFLASVDAG
jgi:hypothetical protein